MKVCARIRAKSHVDRMWRHLGRMGGDLCGVRFRMMGDVFVALDIPPDKAAALGLHSSVMLELATTPLGDVRPAPEPEVAEIVPPPPAAERRRARKVK